MDKKNMNGGYVIGSGGFGCVFQPSLQCKTPDTNDKYTGKKITKLMMKEHADEEYDIITDFQSKLRSIKNYGDYFLLQNISKCDELKDLTKRDLKGYSNKRINILPIKFLAGGVSGIINGLGTLGGMPISLFLLITKVRPIVIRGSLAAIFFIADAYVLNLSFYAEIVEPTALYRILPLILVLPIGIFIGNKFFIKSREETYRKFVFYFLIIISIFGITKVLMNF